MLIRSQDRIAIINVDNVFNISVRDINGTTVIHIGSSSSCCIIAEYSTKEKAMKVLDMIQEAYVEYEKFLQMFMGIASVRVTTTEKEILDKKKKDINKKAIFQMPQDSEVEEWAI